MRKTITVLAIAALAAALMAVPALADSPTEFTAGFTIYGEPDPCTNDPVDDMDTTFTFDVKEHQHNNNTVLIVDSSATSTTGYIGNGTEIIVETGKWFIDRFNWQMVNPETGNRFSVKGNMKIDLETGDIVLEGMQFRCEGGVN